MFEDDRLREHTPAYLDGFFQAEADVEDGAQPFALLVNARSKLQCRDLDRPERDRLRGRVAYAKANLTG